MESMNPGFQWWVRKSQAKALGCTHHARYLGIIPGFWSDEMHLWVSRSDLLNPVEDVLTALWIWTMRLRDAEPQFLFDVGKEIELADKAP